VSPILDAQGNPLPKEGDAPDLLDQVCDIFDQHEGSYARMETRFYELLALLTPRAAEIQGIVEGRSKINCDVPAGITLARMLSDVVMMCLVGTRHAKREAQAKQEPAPVIQMPAPKKEEDGGDQPQT
jgi:hypothetical protein